MRSAATKSIRVFFSSTFRDMGPERAMLVSRTIPELGRRVARLGFSLDEIDLRWGVTEDQIANGQLLPACLDQVEMASPFFVALIGDYYGTTLNTFPDDALHHWPWLAHCSGQSLTEIEIRHGALNVYNPKALFYVKRASASQRLHD